MPRIQLKDGRGATLVYRGDTEDEKIENAVQYRFLQEIMGRMNNRGDLTDETANVILACMQDRAEIIPDKEEVAPVQEVAQPETAAPPDLPHRRRPRI